MPLFRGIVKCGFGSLFVRCYWVISSFCIIRASLCNIIMYIAVSQWNNYDLLVVFSTIFAAILSTIILPIYFFVFIFPLYRSHVESLRLDTTSLIRASDIDILLFVKLMGVNPFVTNKFTLLARKLLRKSFPCAQWSTPFRILMLESFVRQPQFDTELYQFLETWFNQLQLQVKQYASQTKDELIKFDEYLAQQVNNETIFGMAKASGTGNIEIWDILHKTGKINWDCWMCEKWGQCRMLHLIVRFGSPQMVKWFVDSCVSDINIKTGLHNKTAFHFLMERVRFDKNFDSNTDGQRIASILVDKGINVDATDSNGMTAKSWLNNDEVYDLLLDRNLAIYTR